MPYKGYKMLKILNNEYNEIEKRVVEICLLWL